MSADEREATVRIEALRQAFDLAFAAAPRVDSDSQSDLLAMTIGGGRYALRLHEVSGLYADRKIRWLPGSVRELLGLVALRGALLPAYDLRALLGYPTAAGATRWCVVAAHAPVALAFEQFDGHVRTPAGSIAAASRDPVADRSPCIRETVHSDNLVRSVIHVPSVLELIDGLVHRGSRPKE
jgi:chemotaxis signal transduction protein